MYKVCVFSNALATVTDLSAIDENGDSKAPVDTASIDLHVDCSIQMSIHISAAAMIARVSEWRHVTGGLHNAFASRFHDFGQALDRPFTFLVKTNLDAAANFFPVEVLYSFTVYLDR
jgi:hypothetical protein